MDTIPIFRPSVSDKEIQAVNSVLRSGWWGEGPQVKEFENKFAKYIGKDYGIATNSCTSALYLAVKALNLKPTDEVITTPLTFISTAYAATLNNVKVVFADIEPDTLNINPEDIKKKINKNTKVIIPMHYGGYSCLMDEIVELGKENNITIIEDCAHAAGGAYKGRRLGSIGDASVFSFQAVKNIAAGDGGMILTNNQELQKHLIKLRWLGIDKTTSQRSTSSKYSWYYHAEHVSHKFQMSDIAASIGLVQLSRIEELNNRRRKIVQAYNRALAEVKWIITPVEKGYARSSLHNYVVRLHERVNRDSFIEYLQKNGVSSSVHYMPLYLHPVYSNVSASCPVTDKVYKNILTLPLFPDMTKEQFDKIISCIKAFEKEIT